MLHFHFNNECLATMKRHTFTHLDDFICVHHPRPVQSNATMQTCVQPFHNINWFISITTGLSLCTYSRLTPVLTVYLSLSPSTICSRFSGVSDRSGSGSVSNNCRTVDIFGNIFNVYTTA